MWNLFRKSADSEELAQVGAHLENVQPDQVDWRAKDDAYWKKSLTPLQYQVTRQKGTERAFSGRYATTRNPGVYHCSNCDAPLFSSEHKFDSGTGWPSFYEVIKKDALELKEDRSFGMSRTEVLCQRCGAHLGHVFTDGPAPTGLRYCMNSISLIHRSETAPPQH